jgi:putative peptide zinc metalloprotease protein
MFVASVSTILFNANPLLRYDGYYILSDLLEIPNLSNRSRQYLYYLVRKYLWGVRNPQNPAHTHGEKGWFVFYGIASTVYRVFICTAILLMIADKFFILGAMLSVVAIAAWVLTPIVKFLRYLATSGELSRTRGRAIGSVLVFTALIVTLIGQIDMPDRVRVSGVVEAETQFLSYIYVKKVGGFLVESLPSGTAVQEGDVLLKMENPQLHWQYQQELARHRGATARRMLAQTQETAAALAVDAELRAIEKRIARFEEQLTLLEPQAPLSGTWISPQIDKMAGAYLAPDVAEPIGMVVDTDRIIIRATVTQSDAMLIDSARQSAGEITIRPYGRPNDELSGTIVRIIEAGRKQLPSPALGYAGGGEIATAMEDPQGAESEERFFEVVVRPEDVENIELFLNQRVMLRFEMPSKPLAQQWIRSLRQLIQQRFHS